MKASATYGTFCEARPVRTRKVVQFIIEVPVERANSALKALGGYPDAANPRWVGMALLKNNPESRPNGPTSDACDT